MPRRHRFFALLATLMLPAVLGLAASPAAGSQAAADSDPSSSANGDAEEEDDLFEPSNTGYIDSAVIRNRFRFRYDSAVDGDRPDRAEFIYGKCRCFTLAAGQDGVSRGPTADLDYREIELTYERVFGGRWSAFVELPFRSIQLTLPEGFVAEGLYARPSFVDSGISDVRAGLKYGLVIAPERHLTAQVRAYFPTGDALRNLGTDHASIEPALLYLRRLSRRWNLESEARLWIPLGGSSDPETGASMATPVGRVEPPDPAVRNDDFAGEILRFGVGASRSARGEGVRWSPVVELVGWRVLGGYSTPPTPLGEATAGTYVRQADGDTIVNLKVGARVRTREPGSIYFGYGRALTDEVWYDDIFRLEYRRSF